MLLALLKTFFSSMAFRMLVNLSLGLVPFLMFLAVQL
jgi:hypothetical protein